MIKISDDVLHLNSREMLPLFLNLCRGAGADAGIVEEYVRQWRAARKGEAKGDLLKACEDRWMSSIGKESDPDYGVYGEDWYLGEAWCCWAEYSRKYLRGIASPGSMPEGTSILNSIGDVKTVVDLGCGCGLTTAALKGLFPTSDVVGTNLSGTTQTRIAEVLGRRFGFCMASEMPDVGGSCLVFASEYFEHFLSPVKHLSGILDRRPSFLLVANAFGTQAIGHFDLYTVDRPGLFDLLLTGQKASMEFNRALRGRGYRKIKTNLWNGRPTYWNRHEKG